MPTEPTHYEVLGVSESASQDEIRRAYRRLVMKLHPDRSGDAKTTDRFVRVNQAYEVLIDTERRSNYDTVLRIQRERTVRSSTHAAQGQTQSRASASPKRDANPDVSAKIAEAAGLLSQGKYDRAAFLARSILRTNPRAAMAHAILGDVARARQDLRTALERYSLAIQHDPRNQTFQKRYETLFQQLGEIDRYGKVEPPRTAHPALWGVAVLSGLMMSYVAIAGEQPASGAPLMIQTWTVGLIVMMFVNGVVIGATIALTKLLDRWEVVARGSSGKLSTASVLSVVSIINFWVGGLLYIILGFARNSFTYSMSRIMFAVAILTASYAIMSGLSEYIAWDQTLLWGGNVIFLGTVCGWAVADAFR